MEITKAAISNISGQNNYVTALFFKAVFYFFQMAKIVKDPGVGYQSKKNAQRIILDGKYNVKHVNRPRTADDLYTYLIDLSWIKFLGYVLLGYILVNAFFGLFYLLVGIQEFRVTTGSFWKDFMYLFFFSAQTITTVGYGVIAPKGVMAGVISSFEALIGLMSFSFITGLLYGRFSKPKSKVEFSKHLLVRDFEEERALMFRLMNKRANLMIRPELEVVINIKEKDENNGFKRKFYELVLERNKLMYLPTMWTVVHKINKDSPLYKYSNEELKKLDVEIYVLFEYYEETFNQNLYQLHSYDFKDLELDHKFRASYSFNEEGYTIVDHENLSKIEKM